MTPFQDLYSNCNICFETFPTDDIIHTNCNHTYCLECLVGYINSIKDKTSIPNCPACRNALSEFKVHSYQNQDDLIFFY